jgi:hypothetical protein
MQEVKSLERALRPVQQAPLRLKASVAINAVI